MGEAQVGANVVGKTRCVTAVRRVSCAWMLFGLVAILIPLVATAPVIAAAPDKGSSQSRSHLNEIAIGPKASAVRSAPAQGAVTPRNPAVPIAAGGVIKKADTVGPVNSSGYVVAQNRLNLEWDYSGSTPNHFSVFLWNGNSWDFIGHVDGGMHEVSIVNVSPGRDWLFGICTDATCDSALVNLSVSTSEPGAVPAWTFYRSQWHQTVNGASGADNCGPASVSMALSNWGYKANIEDLAKAMKPSDDAYASIQTNFLSPQTQNYIAAKYNLTFYRIKTFADIKRQIDQGNPVLIGITNYFIVRPVPDGKSEVPYASDFSGFARYWAYDKQTQKYDIPTFTSHIVVITAYDDKTIYINDPLAVRKVDGATVADRQGGTSFRVPFDAFAAAAGKNYTGTDSEWYAAALGLT